MNRRATDKQIPMAMAPWHPGTCDRCGRRRDIIWPVYYQPTRPDKENVRELCDDCAEACGCGTRWKYAGGGDVVAIPPGKRSAS